MWIHSRRTTTKTTKRVTKRTNREKTGETRKEKKKRQKREANPFSRATPRPNGKKIDAQSARNKKHFAKPLSGWATWRSSQRNPRALDLSGAQASQQASKQSKASQASLVVAKGDGALRSNLGRENPKPGGGCPGLPGVMGWGGRLCCEGTFFGVVLKGSQKENRVPQKNMTIYP